MIDAPPLRYRRELGGRIAAPQWPAGYRCRTLTPADAPAVHGLLNAAYAQGRGVPTYEDWWKPLSTDDEFDPDLCFLVVQGDHRIVAVAQCWTSAYLKDLAVREDRRGQGIGANLLRLVFRTFAARGAAYVDLKVEAWNEGAIRLYERMGMVRAPL